MKRIQPYYYIIALAALFVLAGLILFSMQLIPGAESTGITVDPQTQDQSETIYDLWFSSAEIYDLSVDHSLNGILFSTENDTVTLLDRERKLQWDKVFDSAPLQAKLSSCGNYAVIGTFAGDLYFTSIDLEYTWNVEGDPVDLIAVSPNASWIAVARSNQEFENHSLELYDKSGNLIWIAEINPLKNLYLSSEYLEQANIYYTEIHEEEPVIKAVNIAGEEIWNQEGQTLAAVSRHGSRLAAVQGSRLTVYDSMGYTLWRTNVPFEIITVVFNPQNYNRILVYGDSEGGGENLYYFDLAEELLWTSRIPDGSLFSFTADGQNIVISSWRHFKEDYTQMIVLNQDGLELNNLEVAMKVERLMITNHPHLVVVSGYDGYIDLINLKPLLSEENDNDLPEAPLYSPVTTGVRAEETMITLFFIDENINLIPVTRSISFTENPIDATLEELIRGPARGSNLYRTIPDKEISIDLHFEPDSGTIYLELSPELIQQNGLTHGMAAFDSLYLTVSSFQQVENIYLTLEQEPIDMFGDKVIASQPLAAHQWEAPLFLPVLSGGRYYLQLQEGANPGDLKTDLDELLEIVVHSFRSLYIVSTELKILNLIELPDRVQVNFNSSIQALFPENATEEDKLKATLMLDAIFLTIFENSRSQRAEIIVEGANWTPPEGYPSLSRFFRKPYFINPE